MFSLDEYDAAHRSVVLGDDPSRGTIAVSGPDRKSFLHGLLTQDIAALKQGSGAYAAYLTPQGRMIADMRVIETGERLLLGVERTVAAPLAARLDALIFSEDAQVKDITGEVDEVRVHGPLAAATIERVIGASVEGLSAQYDNLTLNRYTIVREDAFGVPGFDVYVPALDAPALRAMLMKAGATHAGHDTLEALRIEAGRPLFGVDMDTDTIPLEAGIEGRAISFTKGCYVGQEVIIRVMHRGHGRVARRLVRLVLTAGAVPRSGDKVFAGEQQVGQITSGTDSPKAGSPLAMAYVHRDHTTPGTALLVNGSTAVVYQGRD